MPAKPKGIRKNQSHKANKVPQTFAVGFLGDLDKRTNFARAMRANYQAIVNDLGGESEVSHVKDVVAQRFVWLQAILEAIEQDMVKGNIDKKDALSKWVQAVNSLSGLAKILGVERMSSERPWVTASVVEEARK